MYGHIIYVSIYLLVLFWACWVCCYGVVKFPHTCKNDLHCSIGLAKLKF